jgi:hypothetical protein
VNVDERRRQNLEATKLRPRKPIRAARRPCSALGGLLRNFGVLDEEHEQRLEHGDLAGAEGGEDRVVDGGDDNQREVAFEFVIQILKKAAKLASEAKAHRRKARQD